MLGMYSCKTAHDVMSWYWANHINIGLSRLYITYGINVEADRTDLQSTEIINVWLRKASPVNSGWLDGAYLRNHYNWEVFKC